MPTDTSRSVAGGGASSNRAPIGISTRSPRNTPARISTRLADPARCASCSRSSRALSTRWGEPDGKPGYCGAVDRAILLPQALIIDPQRPQPYRLRLARYAVVAQDISDLAGAAAREGRRLAVLDVGCGWGGLLRHLEITRHFASMTISATDLTGSRGYRKELYPAVFL